VKLEKQKTRTRVEQIQAEIEGLLHKGSRMTIRLSCSNGHSQDVVIDPAKTGSVMIAGFLNRMRGEVAALLDGTSSLYVVPPTSRICQVEGCGKPIKAQVVADEQKERSR